MHKCIYAQRFICFYTTEVICSFAFLSKLYESSRVWIDQHGSVCSSIGIANAYVQRLETEDVHEDMYRHRTPVCM